jgi:AsmA family protein
VRAWVIVRRILIALVACAVILVVAAAGFAAGVDAGLFRGTVIRFISVRAGRPVEVAGALHAHLLSRHPDLVAERVTIGNPSWVPPGKMAEIGEVSMVMDVPWFDRAFGIVSLTMKSVTLHLMRDTSGYANWQWSNPNTPPSAKKMPILRRLSIPGAHVLLDDERRHLIFDGVASAEGGDGGAASPLTIKGNGQLNGHTDSFEITADPLAAASHEIPYHFSYSEHSSGSELKGHGSLPKPFDFDIVDASFEAAGADLRDLYFLTGVTLVNSGTYTLTGNIIRRGTSTRFADLAATTGQSDVRGAVAVDVSSGQPRLDIELDSQFLRMADFGLRAAGRAPETGQPPLLLSNAALNPPTLRHGDADIRYRAKRLQLGRVTLTNVAAKGILERGVLTVAPLTAEILGGKLRSHGRLDARTDDPKARVDITVADLQLAEIGRKDRSAPPATGLLQIRVAATGVGKSVHQVAASANGTVTATVQQGTVRDSLAEMTGADLRGLGLVMTKNQKEIPLRCAVAEFEARDGTLTAKRIVADTAPVLISGEGQIHFDTETLDLAISGHPKSVRLFRFRAPVLVKGTLTHPSIDVQAKELTLVDPGKAKDADCAALESEAASEH